MRLVENLQDVEKKSVNSIRQGVERVREEWADVERRLRQRMRIYPHKQQATQVLSHASQGITEEDMLVSPRQALIFRRPKPIVSAHGRDLTGD